MRHIISILFVVLCFVFVCLARDSSKILKDVCKSDPNLDGLNADGYEEIDEDAFKDCNKLTHIHLDYNNWQKIPEKTFKKKGLSKLKSLWISSGNIPIMDLDLTDLKELKNLGMRNLNITILPSKTFEGLKNLQELSISSNQLFDLDIERILQFTPNLKEIYLPDNNFKCCRLSEIISYLKNKNVTLLSSTWYSRNRNYTPQKLEDIECLYDEQWQAELKANGLESYSLECLRGQPNCTLNAQASESTSNQTNTQVVVVVVLFSILSMM